MKITKALEGERIATAGQVYTRLHLAKRRHLAKRKVETLIQELNEIVKRMTPVEVAAFEIRKKGLESHWASIQQLKKVRQK
jgi:hypothetical protein